MNDNSNLVVAAYDDLNKKYSSLLRRHEELNKIHNMAMTAIRRLKHERDKIMEARTVEYGGIGWAVNHLRLGHKIRRKGWNSSNLWVTMVPAGATQVPEKFAGGYPTTAGFYMKTAHDELVPWLCSQIDLAAGDWELVDAVQPGHYVMKS
jgi:hypothetical protein